LLENLGFTKEATIKSAVKNFEGIVFDDYFYSLFKADYREQ